MEESLKKKVTIIVNGNPYLHEKDEISYKEVVTIAFPDFPQHPEINYSVKYKRGHGDKPEGVLAPGALVKIKDQMSFNVYPTGQS